MGSLLPIRFIWAALILGQLLFAGVIAFAPVEIRSQGAEFQRTLQIVAISMLVVLVPAGMLIRLLIFRGGRDPLTGAVSLQAYMTGTIIFLAMCEGVGFMGLTGWMLSAAKSKPHLIVAVTVLLIQLASFPTGRPLRGDRQS
jgi:hypothetical protein